MRRDADPNLRCGACREARIRLEHGVGVALERLLARLQGPLAEARPAIHRRHERDGDAGLARRIEMRLQHAVGAVNVVELGDRGVAVAQQVDIEEVRDDLRLVRREALDEAIHELAPGPKVVFGAAAQLGQSGHRALERVRVQVRHSRQHRAGERLRAARPGLDRNDLALVDRHEHVLRPAPGEEGVAREVAFHAAMITRCTMPPGSTQTLPPWCRVTGSRRTRSWPSAAEKSTGWGRGASGAARRARSTTRAAPGSPPGWSTAIPTSSTPATGPTSSSCA